MRLGRNFAAMIGLVDHSMCELFSFHSVGHVACLLAENLEVRNFYDVTCSMTEGTASSERKYA